MGSMMNVNENTLLNYGRILGDYLSTFRSQLLLMKKSSVHMEAYHPNYKQ